MTRLGRLLTGVGLALGLTQSLLAAPPVLDRVPTDALVVITTPSLDRLSKSMEAVTANIPVPMGKMGVKEMLAMGGIEQGIDSSKSVAIAIMGGGEAKKAAAPDDEDADEKAPPMVVLIPTTDYKALLGNFNAPEGAAEGIASVQIDGEPAFLKSLGDGWAAMSPQKDVLEKFTGAAGNLRSYETALGKTCGAIADASDLVIIANFPAIKAADGGKIKDKIREAFENSPAAMMGGEEPDFEQMGKRIDALLDQSRIGVLGLKADASGIALDMGAQFNEGSEMAKTFAQAGNAHALLGKLPKQDYVLAFAADLTSPALKEHFRKANPMNKMLGEGKDGAAGGIDPESIDGVAWSMGMSPGAMMGGGVFSSTVAYLKTSKPDALVSGLKKSITDANGKEVEGTQIASKYAEGASKVNGTTVDSWEIKLTPGGDDGEMAGQAMAMLFGPSGGPAGYIAKTGDGAVLTLAKNSLLMSAALDASTGKGSMTEDTLTSQVSERLPDGRLVEGYIGVKSILDMVKSMMAMMGAGGDIDIPDTLPPVGFGLSGAPEGAARGGLFVPMPVIKAIGEVSKAAQNFGGEEMGAPEKDGAGQPKF